MQAFTLEAIETNLTGSNYEIIYLTEDKASWIIHVKKYITIDTFDELWELHPVNKKQLVMFGKLVNLPRFIENYGVDYKFSGTMFRGQEPPVILEEILKKLRTVIKHSRITLNNCLVNWYENGEHYIGPHRDSEEGLYKGSPIISFSLGATRKFRLTSVVGLNIDINIENGDLLIMGGTTQTTHMHSVPKTKRCKDKRISITMRCMK